MKRIVLFLAFYIPLSLFGQVLNTPEFEWVGQFGGNLSDAAYDVTTDKWGNVYVTGKFRLTADADFGFEEYLLQAGSDSDIYIAKYAPDQSLLWAHSFSGGSSGFPGIALTTDTMGNVYLLTRLGFYSNVDFDPGLGVNVISTDETGVGVILKLTSDGEFDWVKSLGGEEPLAQVIPYDITLDDEGNIYTTGRFIHNPDFDPGDETYILTDNGFGSIFVSKLNQDGEFVWVRSLGDSMALGGFDAGWNLSVDSSGNVLVAGTFDDNLYPDTLLENSPISLHGIGEQNMFIAKLDSSGQFLWIKNIGNNAFYVCGNGVVVDQQNNVYVAGTFQGTIDFDPGLDEYFLSTVGLEDTYILKLTPNGDFTWVIATNSQAEGSCHSGALAFDQENNLYATGLMKGMVNFNPSLGDYLLSENYASYVWKMDTLKNHKWALLFGGEAESIVSPIFGSSDISLDDWNNIYTSGVFNDTVDFDPGLNIEEIISNNRDAFLHKLRQFPCEIDVVSISPNDTLTICAGESISLSATLPDSISAFSFKWNTGNTDPAIVISPIVESMYAVETYYSPACTSQDTIIVNVVDMSDTFFMTEYTCDSVTIGIFVDSLMNINGCDSIVITEVLILPPPVAPLIEASITITQGASPFIVSVEEVPDATSYQWSVPMGVQILSGQGANTVTINWGSPALNGNICVTAVNECGLVGEISCMEVVVEIVDGITDKGEVTFEVFPNPANDLLHITALKNGDYTIVLTNSLGEVFRFFSSQEFATILEIADLPNGLYFLSINSNRKVHSEKILIVH